MEFKYIVVCVILYLTYDAIEADSIHNRIQLGSFAEYDILDIIVNSKRSGRNLRRNFSSLGIGRQFKSPVEPSYIKINHGAYKEQNREQTIRTSSSPMLISLNYSIANQIEVNSTGTISVKCCSTIVSPDIVPKVNATHTIDLID
ncbi:uncharacterized protein ELE39_001231 [Cryptosporidium sp. chipmunk genotype I]|uniref:uncharacterized protein n=1 Tax=Cryptosporidium sp. chipmunk genotype I TaxID=1280935 RepID=UPI00351A1C6F|nr:hypothetical protein ELE39_001231 [Cryptosporidium sp. chipmunk genotype I]